MNGLLQSSVNTLTVKRNEFESLNSKFADDLKSMNLKYKNLQSATSVSITEKIYIPKFYTTFDTIRIPGEPVTLDIKNYFVN